jgi:hypothetical protein
LLFTFRKAAGGPDVKFAALTQPLFGLRDPMSIAEDHKLIRPIDPTKHDYYWKPLPQEAIALAQGLDPKKVNGSLHLTLSLENSRRL